MAYEITKVNQAFIDAMDSYRSINKSKGPIQNSCENVIVFAEVMLGIKLYAWQVYFLNNVQQSALPIKERYSVPKEFGAITSRQIGKSTALAVFSIWAAVFNKVPASVYNNTTVGISSASDVQAKKLLYEMKKLIRLGDSYMKEMYKDSEGKSIFGDKFFSNLLADNEPNNTTTITFQPYSEQYGKYVLAGSKQGSVIKSYPATSAVLGETFSVVIIDEAGLTDRITDTFFYDYMYPTGNSTHAIRVYTSTPWVPSGFFYRMVDPDNIYHESSVNIVCFTIDAIYLENSEYYEQIMKTIKEQEADGKLDEVQRAYYCRFVKGEKSYFNPKKVMELFSDQYEMLPSYVNKCDMGVDFGGQVTSRTVITISELDDNNNVKRLYHKVYDVGKDKTLIQDIADLKKRFNVQRIIPDDCPAGAFLIQEMKDKGWDIHPMNFRTDKVSKYGAFRSALNRGKIISYVDDTLKTEMLALEFGAGSRNSVIQHAPGYTDDFIDSFVMSAYFFVNEEGGFKVYGGKENDKKKILRSQKRDIKGIRFSQDPYSSKLPF